MTGAPAWRRARLALLLASACLLLAGLGATDLWAPDEPRYAQVAEELRSLRHGASGLVLLHLNDEVYTQKPPGYFWLAAAFGAPFGRVTETAARLPSALSGMALVWLTVIFGRRLLGTGAGLLGGALLLTTFEFVWVARRVQLDVLLALFETLALFAFWQLDRGIGSRRRMLVALHASLGLAVLTKGPVGFLVPVLVIATHLVAQRRLRTLPGLLPAWALLISLGPALAWLGVAAALAPAGYLGDAVGTNLFGRFFTGSSHARPFYYFFYQLPIDFLPWTLFLPGVVSIARRQVFAADPVDERARASWTFLLAWLGASFVFFSLSGGKRGLYLLPTFPALALLCSDGWLRSLGEDGRMQRLFAWPLAGLALVLAAVGLAGLLVPQLLPGDLPTGPFRLAGGAVLAMLGAGVTGWLWAQRADRRLVIPVTATAGIYLVVFLLVLPTLDPSKSPRPVALAAARAAGPGGTIGVLGNRAMVGGLAYYGERPVEHLPPHDGVEPFVRSGGRAIVIKARHLDRVRAELPVEIGGRFRDGRRALLVVSPTSGDDTAPGPDGPAQAPARTTDP